MTSSFIPIIPNPWLKDNGNNEQLYPNYLCNVHQKHSSPKPHLFLWIFPESDTTFLYNIPIVSIYGKSGTLWNHFLIGIFLVFPFHKHSRIIEADITFPRFISRRSIARLPTPSNICKIYQHDHPSTQSNSGSCWGPSGFHRATSHTKLICAVRVTYRPRHRSPAMITPTHTRTTWWPCTMISGVFYSGAGTYIISSWSQVDPMARCGPLHTQRWCWRLGGVQQSPRF